MRADHVAIRGNQGSPEAVSLPEGNAGVEVGHEDGVAQEILGDVAVFIFHANDVEKTRRTLQVVLRRHVDGAAPNPERNKTAAPGGAGLQVVDGPDALLLAFHNDILEPVSQGRLDGDLVFAGDLDVIGHQPVDAVEGKAGLVTGPDDGAGACVAPLVTVLELAQRRKPGALLPQFLLEAEHLAVGLFQLVARSLDELL